MIPFLILGPVAIAGQPPDGPMTRHRGVRAVLATLLHYANQHVSADHLVTCVWANPPASAHANLRNHIAALRRTLNDCLPNGGQRLTTRRGSPAAYRLAATPDEIDATVFTALADRGHEQLANQHPRQAAKTLRTALHLWRGPIGEDLPNTPTQRAWAAQLTERRLTANDDLAEARLRIGDHIGLVATLRQQLATNPHRERTAELLIRALHATGDRTAAITTYQQFRTQLANDLGTQPSTHLQHLHHALLHNRPINRPARRRPPQPA
jgi:DNA-binding SARP family transcriptional activator